VDVVDAVDAMFVKLDNEVIELLCCPFCKGSLRRRLDRFTCADCGLEFPAVQIAVDETIRETVFDFRIHRPPYCVPQTLRLWDEAQDKYRDFRNQRVASDSAKVYEDEIASVREIYEKEFHLAGRVLDVGGHQGRLRYFLASDARLYVSADPFIDIFQGVTRQRELLKAYPCLSEPCNFLAAHAECLPFKSGSFDWIHIRSCLDHFFDPYLALLEAYRCGAKGARLLVGLAIMEKLRELQGPPPQPSRPAFLARLAAKYRSDGARGIARAVMGRAFPSRPAHSPAPSPKDDHTFRLTHKELLDLLARTGWDVSKQHWVKPPFSYCLYLSATASPRPSAP